jgi:hypothetical protein
MSGSEVIEIVTPTFQRYLVDPLKPSALEFARPQVWLLDGRGGLLGRQYMPSEPSARTTRTSSPTSTP